jgi:hypothetical protein
MRRAGMVAVVVVRTFAGGVFYNGGRAAVKLSGTPEEPVLSVDAGAPPEQIARGAWAACCAWHEKAGGRVPVIGGTESPCGDAGRD